MTIQEKIFRKLYKRLKTQYGIMPSVYGGVGIIYIYMFALVVGLIHLILQDLS